LPSPLNFRLGAESAPRQTGYAAAFSLGFDSIDFRLLTRDLAAAGAFDALNVHPTWMAPALMAPVLEQCDAEGVPAYLESSKESNIPFYERHGFKVTGEVKVKNGPSLWPMWRDPQPLES